MLVTYLRSATRQQMNTAIGWTANNLHVPESEVAEIVAIAYVERHFQQGALSGWEGFCENIKR